MASDPVHTWQSLVAIEQLRQDMSRREAAEKRGRFITQARRCLRPGVKAWLIGSLADGTFGIHSDVDVVVDGLTPDLILTLEKAAAECCDASIDLIDYAELDPGQARAFIAGGLALHAPPFEGAPDVT